MERTLHPLTIELLYLETITQYDQDDYYTAFLINDEYALSIQDDDGNWVFVNCIQDLVEENGEPAVVSFINHDREEPISFIYDVTPQYKIYKLQS